MDLTSTTRFNLIKNSFAGIRNFIIIEYIMNILGIMSYVEAASDMPSTDIGISSDSVISNETESPKKFRTVDFAKAFKKGNSKIELNPEEFIITEKILEIHAFKLDLRGATSKKSAANIIFNKVHPITKSEPANQWETGDFQLLEYDLMDSCLDLYSSILKLNFIKKNIAELSKNDDSWFLKNLDDLDKSDEQYLNKKAMLEFKRDIATHIQVWANKPYFPNKNPEKSSVIEKIVGKVKEFCFQDFLNISFFLIKLEIRYLNKFIQEYSKYMQENKADMDEALAYHLINIKAAKEYFEDNFAYIDEDDSKKKFDYQEVVKLIKSAEPIIYKSSSEKIAH